MSLHLLSILAILSNARTADILAPITLDCARIASLASTLASTLVEFLKKELSHPAAHMQTASVKSSYCLKLQSWTVKVSAEIESGTKRQTA